MESKLPQISPRPDTGTHGGGAGAVPQRLRIAPIVFGQDGGGAAATSTRGGAISRPRPRRRASAPEGMAEAMASATKAVGLDDFELMFKLGEGGGGTVWQCTKKDSLENFAIKIIEKSSIVSTGSVTRLVAERTIMSMFESAFVTKLHFAFQSETQVYFVLELVSGGDLLRVMRQFPGQRMSEDQARFYICELVLVRLRAAAAAACRRLRRRRGAPSSSPSLTRGRRPALAPLSRPRRPSSTSTPAPSASATSSPRTCS
jgi:hypothetical protein